MAMFSISWLWFIVSIINVSYGQYEIPTVTLEAFQPQGFRASIKADPDINLFAFHGKVNKEINLIEPGDFTEDLKVPVGEYFTFFNPNLKLKVGDVIHYWVFVQYKKLGYRKDAQKWTVEELKAEPKADCTQSVTVTSDRKKVCKNTRIFEDNFKGDSLNNDKWILEQYVPGSPDFEFVVYKKDSNVTFLNKNQLFVKPMLMTQKEIDEDVLDLSDGCTRPNKGSPECLHEKFLMQNPIVSGRIVSKLLFSYADIEIKAKLPTGDWLYPELYLEDDNQNRLVIAYARGNKVLTGNDGIDLGGSLLFGGPILSTREPGRSEKLSSTKSTSGTFGESFHTYRLRWTQDSIELFVDGVNFGLINSKSISVFGGSSPKQVRLVLGVGVGGVSDFPDGFKSGTHEKPWKNRNRNQVKTFYAKKEEWFPTWTDNGLLIVDYVRVTSI